jgi:dihydrofolate synthase / folylpolyglutamate synthase
MKNTLIGCKIVTYTALLDHLFNINQQGNAKGGLENMRRLSMLFSQPETKFPCIHIAGSNGKGSVTTKAAKALEFTGLKVGLYTSPHISTFRERICINGKMISEKSVVALLQKIFHVMKAESIDATFFEITTLLAFCYFAENQVDFGIIETGIGGRLDCTNIITPEVSVITSISLEHTSILGNTLEEIAREKAGIIKFRVPVVIGPKVPVELIAPFAKAQESPLIEAKGNFVSFDKENSATAAKCLEVLNVPADAIVKGCALRPLCRVEKVEWAGMPSPDQPKAIILDVAHNPDGLQSLFKTLKQEYPDASLRVLCGLSQNKDIPACVKVLMNFGTNFHLIAAKSSRSISAQDLYSEFINQGTPKEQLFLMGSIEDNLALALKLGAIHREVLVVCGSFFIMAPVRAFLGINEPSDLSR